MGINAQENNASLGAIAENAPAITSKDAKSKAIRKKTKVSPARTTTASATSSSEILFKDPPPLYDKAQPPFIWIDHPQERERLLGPLYIIRLGVGGADQVEISIDKSPWQNCRLTSGYWWFDWSAIQPGKHTLTARMHTPDGRLYRTPPRNCDFRP